MSFELGKAINGGADWICDSPVVFGALSNPVFTALLIAVLALIIIHAMYKNELKGTGWRRGMKATIWMTIGVSALVFVHYYAQERHLSKGHVSQGVRDVVASIHQSAAAGEGYSVYAEGGRADSAPRPDAVALPPRPDAVALPSRSDTVALPSRSGTVALPSRSDTVAPPPRPDNVGRPALPSRSDEAMAELGLQKIVLTSAPGGGA